MNYQLMSEGFPAISVAKEDRLEYFKALDVYAVEGNLQPFADLVAGLVDRQMEKYIEISGPQQGMEQPQIMQYNVERKNGRAPDAEMCPVFFCVCKPGGKAGCFFCFPREGQSDWIVFFYYLPLFHSPHIIVMWLYIYHINA